MKKFERYKNFAERIHEEPFCFAGHIIWYSLIAYGLWVHSWFYIGLGIVIMLIVHLHSALRMEI